jgi:hypothetical protein
VDIDPAAVTRAKNAVIATGGKAEMVQADSVGFLAQFPDKIDFLYLDSYDIDWNNPIASQEHHLREIKAAYPKLTKESVVMIDDCPRNHGGKGRLVVEFLQEKGWTAMQGPYQIILLNKSQE